MTDPVDTELVLQCPECGRTTTGVLTSEEGGTPFTEQSLAVHRFRAHRVQQSVVGPSGHAYSGPPIPGYPTNEPPPTLVSLIHADTPLFSHIETLAKLEEAIRGLEERELIYIESGFELEAKANRLASKPRG